MKKSSGSKPSSKPSGKTILPLHRLWQMPESYSDESPLDSTPMEHTPSNEKLPGWQRLAIIVGSTVLSWIAVYWIWRIVT